MKTFDCVEDNHKIPDIDTNRHLFFTKSTDAGDYAEAVVRQT